MGGVVSAGQNNDDLIDNLLHADYIRTPAVEKVFRAVDRADYFLPSARENAYKDLAWKYGHIHLSAPCIYSEVMEGLRLEPGLSFLNLGSGTGYLSTMAGLLLGSHGINHGVEIHEDVIAYANKKLEDFKRFSGGIDEFDFCEPKFIQGNCLCLANGRQYDRVYCGASCPEQYETYMKGLLRIGGILIMPLNDHLMEIKRVSKAEWVNHMLIPVSFATLILPSEGNQDLVELLEVSPSTLQSLTRTAIRSILRANVDSEHPNLREPKPKPPATRKQRRRERTLKKLMTSSFGMFDESEEDQYSSGDERGGGEPARRPRPPESAEARVRRRTVRTADNIFDIVMDHLGYRVRRVNGAAAAAAGRQRRADDSSDAASEDVGLQVADWDSDVTSNEVDEDLERIFESREEEDESSNEGVARRDDNLLNQQPHSSRSNTSDDSPKHVLEAEKQLETENDDDLVDSETEAKPQAGNPNADDPGTSGNSSRHHREKYDSGYVEEMDQQEPNRPEPVDFSDPDSMGVVSSSSSDDRQGRRQKRSFRVSPLSLPGPKSRRILPVPTRLLEVSSSSSSISSDSEMTEEKVPSPVAGSLTVPSMYTAHMRQKIQELPLPSVLKSYLNFYRDF